VQAQVNDFLNQSVEHIILRTPIATSAGIEYVIHDAMLNSITLTDSGQTDHLTEQRCILRISLNGIQQRAQRGQTDQRRQRSRGRRALSDDYLRGLEVAVRADILDNRSSDGALNTSNARMARDVMAL